MNRGYRSRENAQSNLPVRELKRIRDWVLVLVIACFAAIVAQLFNLKICPGREIQVPF